MILDIAVVGPLQVNCYILGDPDTQEAIVIDPGGDADEILEIIRHRGWRVQAIVNTHGHFDHVLAVAEVQAMTGARFLIHPAEAPVLRDYQPLVRAWLGFDPGPPPEPDGALREGDLLTVGRARLQVVHTPGHSPGGVSLIDREGRRVFTGDTLFAGSVGRTDLPGGDYAQLLRSIRHRLLSLPDDFAVLPGHGPASTIGAEKRSNPYVQELVREE